MADLKSLRRRRFLTQKELAERLGVSYQSVQTWEAGNGMPRLRTIPKLAEVLGVSTDELLKVLNAKTAATPSLVANVAA